MEREFAGRPPSRRARSAAAITRGTLRPLANRLPPGVVGIAVSRRIVAGSLALFGPIRPATTVEPMARLGPDGGQLRGEWVRAAGVAHGGAAILYLHGSGYALCSPCTHRGLTSRLSTLTGLPVFAVDYRLAPRHRFPAAAQDVRRAFDWLVTDHAPAGRIVVAGDSAGGHLALDLCLDLLRSGRPRPAAQVLFSPVVDLTFGLAGERAALRPDPMIGAAAARHLVAQYTRGTDPAHARLRLAVAPDEVLPPTLIQAGGREMLAADAHHIHRMLAASGTPSRLEVWPGQMHVFQALPRAVPEAGPALRRAGEFITDALGADTVARPARRRRSA